MSPAFAVALTLMPACCLAGGRTAAPALIGSVPVRSSDVRSEFRYVLDNRGAVVPDDTHMWGVGPYVEFRSIWNDMAVKLRGLSNHDLARWKKAAREKTVFDDRFGGTWMVRLDDAREPLEEAVCESRPQGGKVLARCYYLFPVGDFAAYEVRWTAADEAKYGEPVERPTVIAAVSAAVAARLAARGPVPEQRTHVKAVSLGKYNDMFAKQACDGFSRCRR